MDIWSILHFALSCYLQSPIVFSLLVSALCSLLILTPLIVLLTITQLPNLSSQSKTTEQVNSNSQSSVILPYDPCVSITPDMCCSTAVTTSLATAGSPVVGKRRSLVTEYFTTVLGAERTETPSVPPEVVKENNVKKEEVTNTRSLSDKRPLKKSLKRNSICKDKSRANSRDSARKWNILSAEIALVYHNARRNWSRRNSASSVKSASVISEEGFQLEYDSDSEKQSPTLASSSKRGKTASLTITVSREDITEDIGSATSTPKSKRDKNKGNSQSLSKKLGNKMLKQGSMRKKGKSFLTSLENMMQKSAARRAAACLEREAEVQKGSAEKVNGTVETNLSEKQNGIKEADDHD